MLECKKLKNEEKQKLRILLRRQRITDYLLEDSGIMLMNTKELFEFLYLDEIVKFKEAMAFIKRISEYNISSKHIDKTIAEIIIEDHENVYKLGKDAYVYCEYKPLGIYGFLES